MLDPLSRLYFKERSNKLATVVVMPKLGSTMTEGRLIQWLVKEGDKVEKGMPLFEVESDKATMEVEALESGILRKILVDDEVTLDVGTPIGIIAGADEELPDVASSAQESSPAPAPPAVKEAPRPAAPAAAEGEKKVATAVQAAPSPRPGATGRIKASPLAKRLAQKHGVSLKELIGTGPGGRIVRDDVLGFVSSRETEVARPEVAALRGELIPLSRRRQIIAQRLSESVRVAPHIHLRREIDMAKTLLFRQQLLPAVESRHGIRTSISDMLVKASAIALGDHPFINSTLEGDSIRVLEEINIGVAVDAEEGLIVPVVRGADRKSLVQISRDLKDLVEKSRSNRLSPDEISGGTFTISNLGMYGVDSFTAIINPPECAILAAGAICEKLVMVDGQVETTSVMDFTLCLDHRIVDGVTGAKFLERLKEILESPYLLVSD